MRCQEEARLILQTCQVDTVIKTLSCLCTAPTFSALVPSCQACCSGHTLAASGDLRTLCG